MELIDEQGRLFGYVNVIDALVILLVASVVIAGLVFILSPDPAKPDTRFATVDLGPQPSHIIEEVDVGDLVELEGHADNLTITDVYYGPAEEGDGHLIVRTEVNGERVEVIEDAWQFTFGGEPLRGGQALSIETLDYEADGEITRVEREDPDLRTSETAVFSIATVSAGISDDLAVGDTYTVNGQEVGTIESLRLYPTEDSERLALLGLSLQTHDRTGVPHFGADPVRVGTAVDFETDLYNVSAVVLDRGTTELATEETTVLLESNLTRGEAENLAAGDTFTVDGETVAEIDDVAFFPGAEDEVTAVVAATYATHLEGDDVRFGDRSVRTGAPLPFETGEYEFIGEIRERDIDGLVVQEQAVVIETEVSRSIADRIEIGDTHEIAGVGLANVEEMSVYPTADRETKRVFLGLELVAEARSDGLTYGDRDLRDGETIPFRTDAYDIAGEIVDPDGLAEPGEPMTTSVTLEKRNVRPERADRIAVEATERIGGEELAEITDKHERPAEVVLESEDGDIFEREHPVNKDLTLEAELVTRDAGETLRFHGEDLREGDEIVLDLGRIIVTVEVTHIQD